MRPRAAEFLRAGWGGPGSAVASRGSPLEGNVDPPAASFPAAPPAQPARARGARDRRRSQTRSRLCGGRVISRPGCWAPAPAGLPGLVQPASLLRLPLRPPLWATQPSRTPTPPLRGPSDLQNPAHRLLGGCPGPLPHTPPSSEGCTTSCPPPATPHPAPTPSEAAWPRGEPTLPSRRRRV